MDAKVEDWVVTPRRGKAVEINALWYNALRLIEGWVREEQGDEAAKSLAEYAEQAYISFNQRFWYAKGGYLYDVIDGPQGDDAACRPNQVLAMSLRIRFSMSHIGSPLSRSCASVCSLLWDSDRLLQTIQTISPSTSATYAPVMRRITKERYGHGSSAPLSMRGSACYPADRAKARHVSKGWCRTGGGMSWHHQRDFRC